MKNSLNYILNKEVEKSLLWVNKAHWRGKKNLKKLLLIK